MSSPFVTFPGTSGNYVFTEDVNLLDASLAHVVSSQPYSTGFGSMSQLDADANGFKGARLSTSAAGTVRIEKSNALTVTASTLYTLMFDFTNGGSTDVTMSCALITGGGDVIFSPSTVIGAGETATYIGTGTVPASPTDLTPSLWLRFNNAENGADYDFRRIMLAEGSHAEWVPSTRVVGDLDLRAKIAKNDWNAAYHVLFDTFNSGTGGYRLSSTAAGGFEIAAHGATGGIAPTTTAPTLVDGQTTEIRATLDVSAGDLVWYQDDVQVDTDTFTAQALKPSGYNLFVGCTVGDALHWPGNVYWVEARDGIGGPVVARFDAADVLAAL